MRYPVLCLAIALPLLTARPALAAPGPAEPRAGESTRSRDHADDLFDKGKEAFNLGKIEDAYALYQKAWALKQTHDIAGNMAQAELKLGKVRAAAEHISFAIAHFPPTSVSDPRPALEKVLVGLRQQLGVMRLKLNVPGAKIAIDGRALGESQSLDEVFVEPGTHTFVAELAGYANATATAMAMAGSRNEVTLTLVKEAPVERVEPPVPPKQDPKPPGIASGPSPVLLVVGGVLAVAGIATGIGLTVAANGKGDEVATFSAQVPGRSACTGVAPPSACAELSGAAATRDTLSNAAAVSFLAGGTFALVTAGLGIWSAKTPSKTGIVRAAPIIGASQGGVMISGSW